jgi:hypothetical protein
MESERREYKGHRIELLMREGGFNGEGDEGLELLIDDEPVRYGQLSDGLYFLRDYAYDWTDNLMDLASRLIDYRDTVDEIRRNAEAR